MEPEPQNDITPSTVPNPPRAGWAESFRQMAENGDDALVWESDESLSSFDHEEWEW